MENEENFSIENNINNDNDNQEKSLGAITNSYYNENSQENSKIFLNEGIIKEPEQIKDLSDNSFRNSRNYKNNLLESEEIFIKQKQEIKKIREKLLIKSQKNSNKINDNINIAEEDIKIDLKDSKNNLENIKEDEILFFSLKDDIYFEISLFNYDEADEEKDPQIPKFTETWNPSNTLYDYYKHEKNEQEIKYIEFSRLALRSIKEVDYFTKGLELSIKMSLIGQSELWIFTRCFINKSINESSYFDEKSANIEENNIFNKYSSVIKIVKEKNSNKCFASFGTFYQEKNNNNKLYYKCFLKRQLIDYSEIERTEDYYYYNENDKCEFEIFITDFGEELINTKIFLNNKNKFNNISGKFFLPINKKAKFIIAGSGKSVQIKDLKVNIIDKKKRNFNSTIEFESDNETPKNCECCSIT